MALYVNTTFTNISTVSSNIPLLNVSLLNISDQKSNNVSVNDITVNNYDVDTTLQVLSLDVKNDAIIGGDLTAPNFDLSLSSLTVQSLNVTTSIDCTGTSVFDNLTVTDDLIVTGDLDLTTAEVNDIDVSSVFYCTLMELTSDISSATTNATNLDCSNNINTDLAVGGDVEVVASVTTNFIRLETQPILEYKSLMLGFILDEALTFHSLPVESPCMVRFDDPMYVVEKTLSSDLSLLYRKKFHPFACSLVEELSYDTLTCAPIATNLLSALTSVILLKDVVITFNEPTPLSKTCFSSNRR